MELPQLGTISQHFSVCAFLIMDLLLFNFHGACSCYDYDVNFNILMQPCFWSGAGSPGTYSICANSKFKQLFRQADVDVFSFSL